jgi:hypothetical protein
MWNMECLQESMTMRTEAWNGVERSLNSRLQVRPTRMQFFVLAWHSHVESSPFFSWFGIRD